MKLSELIAALDKMRAERGDQEVFMGSYYQDVSIDEVVWEDGYPLIVGRDHFIP